MVDFGIKVSPAGVSVDTVSAKEARFLTNKSNMRVYKWETITFTLNSGNSYTKAIPHDLGYAPSFDIFIKGTANYSFLTATTYSNAWYPLSGVNAWFPQSNGFGVFAYSDDSNLYIKATDSKSYTLTIRYYILIDPAQEFSSSSSISLTDGYGMKASKATKNVFTGEEYDMEDSSKYKSLQYFKESIKDETLTLPAMFASIVDIEVEEATYVDFNHGLGYAPFFLAYFVPSSGILREIPYSENDLYYASGPGYYNDTVYEVSAWSDATRIRVTFRRKSGYLAPDGVANQNFSAQTITVRVIPFAENLGGLDNG